MNSIRITTLGCLAMALLSACGRTTVSSESRSFSKNDSLTEHYLILQDTLLHVWNKLVHHENEKVQALGDLLTQLGKTSRESSFASVETRFTQIKDLHLSPKILANPEVLEEYDFAHESLLSEIMALVNSPTALNEKKLQELLDKVKIAESNVLLNREDYDSIAQALNDFLSKNQSALKEIDKNCNTEQRPLFNTVSKK